MAKYHINPVTGEAGSCSATKGPCPFGGPDEHFDSLKAAGEAYEVVMAEHMFLSQQDTAAGAAALARQVAAEEQAQRELSEKAGYNNDATIAREGLLGYATMFMQVGQSSDERLIGEQLQVMVEGANWKDPKEVANFLNTFQGFRNDFEEKVLNLDPESPEATQAFITLGSLDQAYDAAQNLLHN